VARNLELLVAESVGLDILWEEIREEPRTTVCGEIRPEERLIVMNERRRGLLESTPGLYNTTVAHELGHWWLHVDHGSAAVPIILLDRDANRGSWLLG
jgi:hypothetical protein